jgi:hypothetical protein
MLPHAGLVAHAQTKRLETHTAGKRTAFTDKEIIDGFLKIAFGAELRVGGASDRIRKYTGPVRVYVESRAKPDRRAQVAAVVADIRARVRHLDIAVTANRGQANVEVILVRDLALIATLAEIYGKEQARQIERSLQPQCLSSLAKDDSFRVTHSRVILVVDAGQFIFLDCAYEEILQSLGLTNDTDVPWTMFNDDVQMGYFGVYDQYILNILYHPNIKPGMTADEVVAQMPHVLPAVRAWVAKINDLGE